MQGKWQIEQKSGKNMEERYKAVKTGNIDIIEEIVEDLIVENKKDCDSINISAREKIAKA